MLNKRVYLAGPIFGKADAECMGWRMDAAHWLRLRGFKPVDPMRRDYRGREDICPEKIVSQDQEDIFSCGYMLANANAPSWGTAMELVYGRATDCSVVAFATFANSPAISPWLRQYTDAIYESLDHALAGIASGSTKGMR
jgi:nucleoside 2-deoxyribosyltransferase